jgi:hypothetical protein
MAQQILFDETAPFSPPPNTSHYTPSEMAFELAEQTICPLMELGLFPDQIRVFDPAAGQGHLLTAAGDVLAEYAVQRSVSGEHRGPGPFMSIDDARHDVAIQCLAGNEPDVHSQDSLSPDELWEETIEGFWQHDALFTEFVWSQIGWTAPPNVVLMNPPFLGGGRISGVLGAQYRKDLQAQYPGCGGRCDLAGYFLRAVNNMMAGGTPEAIGCIATNTIAQGDTRLGGLSVLLRDYGWDVFYCSDSVKWPGRAKVAVKMFVLTRGIPLIADSSIKWFNEERLTRPIQRRIRH